MKLLTHEELMDLQRMQIVNEWLPEPDPIVQVRLFIPRSTCSWNITGAIIVPECQDTILFGYIDGDYREIGSFWLGELEEISAYSFDYRIKRDLDWEPKPLSQVITICSINQKSMHSKLNA